MSKLVENREGVAVFSCSEPFERVGLVVEGAAPSAATVNMNSLGTGRRSNLY